MSDNSVRTFVRALVVGGSEFGVWRELVRDDQLDKVNTQVENVVTSLSNVGVPDYTAGVSYGQNGTYTMPASGLFLLNVPGRSNGEFYINGVKLCAWSHHYNYTEPSWTCFPVGAGDVIKTTGAAYGTFFPFKTV